MTVHGDTSDVAGARYVELLRARSPRERGEIMSGLVAAVRQLAEASVRSAFPNASEREVRARVAARIYGIEVARRFFPEVPFS